VVLGLIAALQAALLVLIGLVGEPLARGAFLSIALVELMLGVAVLAVTSMALGLVVSACVRSSETTLTVLVLLSIGQVMLSGAVLPLGSGPKQWVSYVAPAQWGFAGTASTVNLKTLLPPHSSTETIWAHTPSAWLLAVGMQVALAGVFAFIAWWRLIQISPGRSRRPARLPTAVPSGRPAYLTGHR